MQEKTKNILRWILMPIIIIAIIFIADILSGVTDMILLKYSGIFDTYKIVNELSEIGTKGVMIHFAELDRFAITCGFISIAIYLLSLIPIYFITKKVAPSNKKKTGLFAIVIASLLPIYFFINLMIKFIL